MQASSEDEASRKRRKTHLPIHVNRRSEDDNLDSAIIPNSTSQSRQDDNAKSKRHVAAIEGQHQFASPIYRNDRKRKAVEDLKPAANVKPRHDQHDDDTAIHSHYTTDSRHSTNRSPPAARTMVSDQFQSQISNEGYQQQAAAHPLQYPDTAERMNWNRIRMTVAHPHLHPHAQTYHTNRGQDSTELHRRHIDHFLPPALPSRQPPFERSRLSARGHARHAYSSSNYYLPSDSATRGNRMTYDEQYQYTTRNHDMRQNRYDGYQTRIEPSSVHPHSWNPAPYFSAAREDAIQNRSSPAMAVHQAAGASRPSLSRASSTHTRTTRNRRRPSDTEADEQHASDLNSFVNNNERALGAHSTTGEYGIPNPSDQLPQLQYHSRHHAFRPPSASNLMASTFRLPPWLHSGEATMGLGQQMQTTFPSSQIADHPQHWPTDFSAVHGPHDHRSGGHFTNSRHEDAATNYAQETTPTAGTTYVVDSMTSLGRSAAPLLPMPEEDSEEPILHYSERTPVPLASDEDSNWLSEVLCFVRCELVEVFRATGSDVASRNSTKCVKLGQVGIRCRFCAHQQPNERASRATSFPSSLDRIYQSLTMMLRDHFGKCEVIPPRLRFAFLDLKSKTCQGATDSKNYWVYAAMKRGLVDSANGIWVNANHSAPLGPNAKPYQGSSTLSILSASAGNDHDIYQEINNPPVYLVDPMVDNRLNVPQFLVTLMSQVQRVELEECERTGNRQSLMLGLPGLGCLYCCRWGRKGMCRLFPSKRRTLTDKIHDMWDHIRRCPLCPSEVQTQLAHLHLEYDQQNQEGRKRRTTYGEKEFLDRVWTRMGHSS